MSSIGKLYVTKSEFPNGIGLLCVIILHLFSPSVKVWELMGPGEMEGARRATGISPGDTSPPTTTVTLSFVPDRVKMFLETTPHRSERK